MIFEVPNLLYEYEALEPYIDAATMHLHHDKHHGAYVAKLNEAIAKYPELESKSVEDLLANLNVLPEDIRLVVRNHGGGHANHSLFWSTMTPDLGQVPTGALLLAIEKSFGSVGEMQEQFNASGVGRFGSGWVWLVQKTDLSLEIVTTANQDSPISQGNVPLLGNDVWEHAYYLTYNNRRADYLKAWWSVVDWKAVEGRFRS